MYKGSTVDDLLMRLVDFGESKGADVIGYFDASDNVNKTVHKKLDELSVYCTVSQFGAVGDGIHDDTGSIQRGIDYLASIGGGTLFFPEGTYIGRTTIILRDNVNLEGIYGFSKILFGSDFIPPVGLYTTNSAFLNEHFATSHNPTTADKFVIKNMTFENTSTVTTLGNTLFIGNTDGVIIDNCIFNNIGTVSTTSIYAYTCNYNITVKNSKFYNYTGADAGGHLWLANIVSVVNSTNITYNATVINNEFITNAADEPLGIYGRDTMVKKVLVSGNRLYAMNNGSSFTSKLLTFFGRTSSNGKAGAGVQDAIVTNNIFEAEEIGSTFICVGGTYSSTDILKDIIIDNNILLMKTDLTSNPVANGIMSVTPTACPGMENVVFSNNTVKNIGTNPCKAAIYQVSKVENNKIYGEFSSASIDHCTDVVGNSIYNNTQSCAIMVCNNVDRNIINNCLYAFRYFGSSIDVVISGNIVTIPDIASSFGVYASSGTNRLVVDSNTFYTNNATSYALYISSTLTEVIVTNNRKYGIGKFTKGYKAYKCASNNRVDDNGTDTLYTGRISDTELEDALPIGHVTWDTTAVSPAMGYRKITTGHGVSAWSQIKSV